MSVAIVYPTRRDVKDPALSAAPLAGLEVGWLARIPDDDCAFCALGCCVQVVVTDVDRDAVVIHGVLGEA